MSDLLEQMSRTDLAEAAGVTPQTLRNWEKQKLIPGPTTVSGNLVTFDQSAVLAVLAYARGVAPSPAQKARDSLAEAERTKAAYESRKVVLLAAPPALSDEEGTVAHLTSLAAVDRAIEAAARNVEDWRAKVATADAEAADRQARAEWEVVRREAEAAEPLVRSLDAVFRMVTKSKLVPLRATKDRVAAANAKYGARFGRIEDPEDRVRGTPARMIPAEFADETRWMIGDRPATIFTINAKGERVPTQAGAQKIVERVQVRPERYEGFKAPPSFTKTELLALDGSPIWPPAL